MSDEVLYYANSEFMSRKGIEYGSITLHPDGIAHGPQPGRTEASIGQKETNELAVMIDTFRALHVSREAVSIRRRPGLLSLLARVVAPVSKDDRRDTRSCAAELGGIGEP